MLKKMTHMVFPMILMLQACLFTYAHADASAAVVLKEGKTVCCIKQTAPSAMDRPNVAKPAR